MTLEELNQTWLLSNEIAMNDTRLSALKIAEQREQNPEIKALLFEHRSIVEERHQWCIKERERLEAYTAGISDNFLRRIFFYRFVKGLSWSSVASNIGGGNTSACLKMKASRYVREH